MLKLFILAAILFFLVPGTSFAIANPSERPNNKVGVHILFPSELREAAPLVNSSGGDWGYVTIPIQAGERDLDKWQDFMDEAKKLHIIPIVRLSSEGDYFNKVAWRKPDLNDVLDFSNFLNSLNWPTKNRYIVVFNEVNRGDEWGGTANPSEYAEILHYAVTAFKTKSGDFFIISSGMDNAAENNNGSYNQYSFFEYMNDASPGIFDKIDGIGSHSYPNPAFSQPPSVMTTRSIGSFLYEKSVIEQFSSKKLPVFITETGWSQEKVGENNAAGYLEQAYTTVWNSPDIVAVTPFLLRAGQGPFSQFSFYRQNGDKNLLFHTVERLPKTKGEPVLPQGAKIGGQSKETKIPIIDFTNIKEENPLGLKAFKIFLKWTLKM